MQHHIVPKTKEESKLGYGPSPGLMHLGLKTGPLCPPKLRIQEKLFYCQIMFSQLAKPEVHSSSCCIEN